MIVLSTSVHNAEISLYNITSVVLNNALSAIRFYPPPHNFESAFWKKQMSFLIAWGQPVMLHAAY